MFNDKFFLSFFEDSPEFFEDSPDISKVFAEGSGFCRLPEIHVMSIHFPPLLFLSAAESKKHR